MSLEQFLVAGSNALRDSEEILKRVAILYEVLYRSS